jgi:hypothetical protein
MNEEEKKDRVIEEKEKRQETLDKMSIDEAETYPPKDEKKPEKTD